jgi:hypothetical protein
MKAKTTNLFKRYWKVAALCLFYTIAFAIPVYADQWSTVVTAAGEWIERLGAAVLVIGGVMFGLGWKNDDADSRTRGLQTMVAGAVTVAMAELFSGLA